MSQTLLAVVAWNVAGLKVSSDVVTNVNEVPEATATLKFSQHCCQSS